MSHGMRLWFLGQAAGVDGDQETRRACAARTLQLPTFIVSPTPGLAARPPLRATLAPHFGAEVQEYDRACDCDRRRRSDGDDTGGGADAGGDGRPHRRATRQLQARKLALQRPAL